MTATVESEFVTSREACRIMGQTTAGLRDMRRRGFLRLHVHYELPEGMRVRYYRHALVAYMKGGDRPEPINRRCKVNLEAANAA